MDLTKLGGSGWTTNLRELAESSRLISPSKSLNSFPSPTKSKTLRASSKKLLPVIANANEKPASRTEIAALEAELLEKTAIIEQFSKHTRDTPSLNLRNLHEPLRDNLLLFRSRLVKKLNLSEEIMHNEVWVQRLVQAECMSSVCEETASKLCGMLLVSSNELGVLMKKLKGAYESCFAEMRASSEGLQTTYQVVLLIPAAGEF